MRLNRKWGLALVVGLSACISDNPTGVSHVGLNYVDNIRMYQAQQLLVVDEVLECEVIDFNEFADNSLHDPLAFTVFGQAGSAEITDWTDSVSDCGTGDIVLFATDVAGAEDDDLRLAGNGRDSEQRPAGTLCGYAGRQRQRVRRERCRRRDQHDVHAAQR